MKKRDKKFVWFENENEWKNENERSFLSFEENKSRFLWLR